MSKRAARAHAVSLAVLLALFMFRVVAQVIQAVAPVDDLLPFEAWHSGTLPYPALLAAQIAIIVLFAWLALRFWRAEPLAGARLRIGLWGFGILYFVVSILRLVSGFTFATGNRFMAAHLPAFFHIVLASAVIVIASYVGCSTTKAATR